MGYGYQSWTVGNAIGDNSTGCSFSVAGEYIIMQSFDSEKSSIFNNGWVIVMKFG